MKKVSATQIKLYRECRQQYYDKYNLRKSSAQSTAALMGSAIHYAFERYYTRGEPVIGTFSRYVRETLNKWQDTGTDVEYHYSQAEVTEIGLDILRNFDYSSIKCMHSELRFQIPFYDIAVLNGVIDMITHDGRLIDFKTSKKAPKIEQLQKDPQFLIYPWAHFQLFGVWPTSVIWYHLRTQEQLEFKFDWNNFDNIVVNTVREMVTDDFSDLTNESCGNCVPWCYRYRNRE